MSDWSVYATWHWDTQWQVFITVTTLPYYHGSVSFEPWATLILFPQVIPLGEQDPYHKLLFFILCKANAILLPNVPPNGLITVNIISSFLWQKLCSKEYHFHCPGAQHDNPPQSGGLSHWAHVPILQMLKMELNSYFPRGTEAKDKIIGKWYFTKKFKPQDEELRWSFTHYLIFEFV